MSATEYNVRAILLWLGVPRRWLKSKKQVEATRRHSEAAKKGWITRREKAAKQ